MIVRANFQWGGAKVSEDGLTLGARRKSKRTTIPGVETHYWLPCIAQIDGVEWPHAFFLTSSYEGHLRCHGCRRTSRPPLAPKQPEPF